MRNLPALTVLFVAAVFARAGAASALDPLAYLDRCNVVWDKPSQDAHGSMPLGNGDVGVNAWVEPSGDLVFYVSKTDAWDENDRLCKLGRMRVKFDPPLDVKDGFNQELRLRDGVIKIQSAISLRLWVDADQPVVRVEAQSATPVGCRAEVELWRLAERPFGDDDSHSGSHLARHPNKPVVLPDVVASVAPRVEWCHRNTRLIYALSLENQNLHSLQGKFTDPLLNHTFGARMVGDGMVKDGERAMKSSAPAKVHQLALCILAERAATPEIWHGHLDDIEHKAVGFDKSRQATVDWWKAFWLRSWVVVEDKDGPTRLTRSYVLQRFMNASAGRGASPIKFNGSIFTVENKPGASPDTPEGCPDWRQWGGCYWFQNTRPSYWAMLPTGDERNPGCCR